MDLLTLGLLWYGAKLFKGQKTADALEYFPKQVLWSKKLKSFVFYMEILNPTNNDLKVDSFFAGLFINESKVGSVERGNPFVIKKNQRSLFSFPVKVIGIGLGQAIVSFIKNPKQAITVKVVGIAKALGIDNPVDEEIPLKAASE
jgi:LEA14-like dessication related protein